MLTNYLIWGRHRIGPSKMTIDFLTSLNAKMATFYIDEERHLLK